MFELQPKNKYPSLRNKVATVISLSIVTRQRAGRPGFNSRQGLGFFLHRRVQTGSETEVYFPRG